MHTEIKVHSIQASILVKLLFNPSARFAELNDQKIETDHFNFHLQSLVKAGLVKKKDSGEYELTTEGKEFANRFDTEEQQVERQPKVSVIVVGVRKQGNKTQYLMQKRLKNPYYGFYGFVGGKVRWGETIEESAAREFFEEAGLSADLTLTSVWHKMDYNTDGNLLEDKVFLRFRADNCQGDLIEKFEGGENIWLTKAEISKLPDLFPSVEEIVESITKPGIQFVERKFIVDKY